MKKLILLFLTISLLVSCEQETEQTDNYEHYTIEELKKLKGDTNITQADKTTSVLVSTTEIDSIIIAKTQFTVYDDTYTIVQGSDKHDYYGINITYNDVNQFPQPESFSKKRYFHYPECKLCKSRYDSLLTLLKKKS